MDLQAFATELVAQTKDYIYIRPEDGLFIMRPNRVHHLNKTAVAMLSRLYDNNHVPDVDAVVREVAVEYRVDEDRVRDDLYKLLVSIAALLRDDVCGAPAVRERPFGTHKRELPVLSEIALTYSCQNRCVFCYAESPARGGKVAEMSTPEVKTIVDRIFDETFDRIEEVFPDFGTCEFYEDEKAGADNGAGSERQFAYCQDGDPLVIAFAPKSDRLPESHLRGLMRHEFGHALEYRYGVKELEYRLRVRLPAKVERRADANAEAVVTFTPEEGGSYRFVVSGRDRREREVRSSTWVWVSGPEHVSWRRENNDRITLISDKASYLPG